MDTTDLVVSRIKALLELDSNNALEPKLSGHVRTVLKAASEVIEANCPDTIQVSRAEYEADRRDAERYREARQGKAMRVECVNPHGKPVIYLIGERDEAVDFPEQYDAAIDAAINMPDNREGGE
jgi:hypothetical protein